MIQSSLSQLVAYTVLLVFCATPRAVDGYYPNATSQFRPQEPGLVCNAGGRTGVRQETLEECAAWCSRNRACGAFYYDPTRGGSMINCWRSGLSCEHAVVPSSGRNDDETLYLPHFNKFTQVFLGGFALYRENQWIDSIMDESLFPASDVCLAAKFRQNSGVASRPLEGRSYRAQCLTAPLDIPNNRAIGKYYDSTTDDPLATCAKHCFEHNLDPASTQECDAFNTVFDFTGNHANTSAIFRCELLGCSVYDIDEFWLGGNANFNNQTGHVHEGDKFGWFQTSITPGCRGKFVDTGDEMFLGEFVSHRGYRCDVDNVKDNRLITYLEASSHDCAHLCLRTGECVGFFMTRHGRCNLMRQCNAVAAVPEDGIFFFSRKEYGPNLDIAMNQHFSSTCRMPRPANDEQAEVPALPGNELHPISSVLSESTVDQCAAACDADTDCVAFDYVDFGLQRNKRCFIMKTCDVMRPAVGITVYKKNANPEGGFDWTKLVDEFEPVDLGDIRDGSCIVSDECAYNGLPFSFCSRGTRECTTEKLPCRSHRQCWGRMNRFRTRLAVCARTPGNRTDSYCVDAGHEPRCNKRGRCSRLARAWVKEQGRTGESAITLRALNRVDRDNAVLTVMREMEALQNAVNKDVFITIKGRETAVIPVSLIDTYGVELVNRALIRARCGLVECEISTTSDSGSGNRRMLQDADVPVTLTYDVDDAAFQELVNSGFDFNDTEFVFALANALGVEPGSFAFNVNANDTDSEISIDFTLVDDNQDGFQGDEETLAELLALNDAMQNVTQVLETELGLPTPDFVPSDLCGTRTCNGRGTCEPSTGICACTGGYSGFDCQFTPGGCSSDAQCLNGGTCDVPSGMCQCQYPFFGPTCSDQSGCTACSL